jgi:hypothetical protein
MIAVYSVNNKQHINKSTLRIQKEEFLNVKSRVHTVTIVKAPGRERVNRVNIMLLDIIHRPVFI